MTSWKYIGRQVVARPFRSLVPFALAGVALFGIVLDEIDVSHDDVQGVSILGAGAATGLVAALVVARWAASVDGAARARSVAWDVVRFVLAFEMVRYGMAKVVGMQFYPQYWRLDLRPTEMTKMSLAWVFFGRTYGYPAIAGVIEVTSGVLLCFRRTTLLGACVLVTALAQVVLVDFFYDVNVRLFACVYLAMDVSLIAREAPRLRTFFLQPSQRETSRRRARVLQAVLVALVLGLPAAEILHDAARYGVFHVDALEGAWSVDRSAGLDDLLVETPGAWERIYFEKGDFGFVRVGKKRVRFDVAVGEPGHALRLSSFDGHASTILEGTFDAKEHDRVHFEGNRDGRPFSLDLTRDFPR
jgi:uncharacterized membrane protein YphA (DoxX/SURF4 family)